MQSQPSPLETCEQVLREQEPNFFRLYLNPHVAQACFCLDRYVSTTWTRPPASSRQTPSSVQDCQSFLANGLEEALSGALKLARYNRHKTGRRSLGLVLDPADRLIGFAHADLPGGGRVEFLPGLRVIGSREFDSARGSFSPASFAERDRADFDAATIDPLVLVAGAEELLDRHAETIRTLVRRDRPLVITCVDRASLAALRSGANGILGEIVPDIVVFDESFVNHAVPFAAFTARQSLFACWNRPGKATFHSTTFQPNTISARHFMRCVTAADAEFSCEHSELLASVLTDVSRRGDWFRRYYNPALYRLIRATGFRTAEVRAAGSFVFVNGRAIFDGVSGVACSFRGHNPPTYVEELQAVGCRPSPASRETESRSAAACSSHEAELRGRLEKLTGLECFLPAVSGATAVENALKIALVAQYPKRHILALKAGFGGKTLFALTGTANPSYKEQIDPLYADVHYVDPFAPDAEARIDALLAAHEFAVVQAELIQGVGGVRPIPENVIRHLDEGRKRRGYLLLVDEVQTGMYRTGPFAFSRTLGLMPDLLLLGKATSDMMYPFALTLYSAAVKEMLERRGSDLAGVIQNRFGYDQGYKTVLNVLRQGEELGVSRRVADASALFAQLLQDGLASSEFVRDIRVFGLLIGIELDAAPWPRRWLRKRLSSIYLFSMLRHANFPVFAGFCQYEPNVLKITPPLDVSPDEIRQACATIIDVLRRPLPRVLATLLGGLFNPPAFPRKTHEHASDSALEPVAH
jgi:acetylornithine/succinyldiaminopimelate/putrescine aminotransferase